MSIARNACLIATCGVLACAAACASSPSDGVGGAAGLAGASPTAAGAGGNGASGGSAGLGNTAAGSAGAGNGGSVATGGTASGSGGGGAAGANAGGEANGGSAGASATLDCAGRLVCDDFEKAPAKGSAPGAPWKLKQNNGTVTYDDTRAASGKYSVKVSISATTPDSTYRQALLNIDGAPLLPSATNKIYGRFMVYTDRIPNKSVHWTFAHGDGPYAATGTTATYNYGGMGNLMANYYRTTQPSATDCWQTKDESFTTGKWQCVAFAFDGPNNEMRFWMGKNEVPELHVVGNQKSDQTCTVKGVDGKWYAPTFKNVSVGWESYQHDTEGAHDAWIDDVILDDEAVACP